MKATIRNGSRNQTAIQSSVLTSHQSSENTVARIDQRTDSNDSSVCIDGVFPLA